MEKKKKKKPTKIVKVEKHTPTIKIEKATKSSSKKVTPKKVTKVEPKQKKKKGRGGKFVNVLLTVIMLLCIGAMIAVIAFGTYIVLSAPTFDTDKLYNKEASIFYDKDGNEFARVGGEQRELVTYDQLPEVLIDAIVATEDSKFFLHNGFDIIRFTKASLGQLSGNSGAGGASTLTMQVAKNAFSRKEDGTIASHGKEGIIRKFTDIYISIFLIEKNYTKEEIIEFYVNEPYLGTHSYGVEQASQTYFGKHVTDLTLAEASLIAGIFNAPSAYNPFANIKLATERRDTVLYLMQRHGYITEEEKEDASNIKIESLIVEPKQNTLNKYQQFIDIVCQEIYNKYDHLDPYATPMEVYTTMDPKMQDIYVKLNNGELNYKWKTYKRTNYADIVQFGSILTDVHDGSIRAVDGGRHQKNPKSFNRATQTKTSPGSTIKPIMDYGPYIEFNKGNTGTIFFDNKMKYSNGQDLTNADKSYRGPMTMRQALAQSRNIPAVQAFMAVKDSNRREFVHNLGINFCPNPNDNYKTCPLYESAAIGGGLAVSPKDMAGAYGAFARGGDYIEPYSFTKIIFRETDEELKPKINRKNHIMEPSTAYMITDMLMTATKQGVGGKLNVSGTQIASKTGTSTHSLKNVPDSASQDNWIISYSPDYVVASWYGTDRLSPKEYITAMSAHYERMAINAQLVNNMFKKNSKFRKPSDVISAKYEKETYPPQLPSAHTPSDMITTELFIKGTQPEDVSERYQTLKNPTNGGATVNGQTINLSWNKIANPDAIDENKLSSFFKENYGRFDEMYFKKRLEYNAKNIGTLGYQVYLEENGIQKLLAYTNEPYYTYTAKEAGTYNFIIKSCYSIFQSNASTGLNITAKVTSGFIPPTPPSPIDPEDPDDKPSNPDIPDIPDTTPEENLENKKDRDPNETK